jgi:hypothetical protein
MLNIKSRQTVKQSKGQKIFTAEKRNVIFCNNTIPKNNDPKNELKSEYVFNL